MRLMWDSSSGGLGVKYLHHRGRLKNHASSVPLLTGSILSQIDDNVPLILSEICSYEAIIEATERG